MVSGEEYQFCAIAAQNYWSNGKPGIYGSGLINNANDPFKATRVGMLGEVAFGRLIGKEPNFAYLPMGDSGDFTLAGRKIDVKTATKKRNDMLIYRVSEVGDVIELKSHIYVAQYLEWERREEQKALITTVGWISRERAMTCVLQKSRINSHQNLVIAYSGLKEIGGMIQYAGSAVAPEIQQIENW